MENPLQEIKDLFDTKIQAYDYEIKRAKEIGNKEKVKEFKANRVRFKNIAYLTAQLLEEYIKHASTDLEK